MKHIPNALTVLRIILTPVYIWLAFYVHTPQALLWAWVVFLVSALTDWLDGTIARKYNVISNFGKIWDPLADKLIVLSALAAMTWKAPIQLSVTVFFVIFAREVSVTVMREIYARKNIVIAADIWGKIKTVLQMVGISVYLGLWAGGIVNPLLLQFIRLWFWIVAVVTVLSGINYLHRKKSTEI